MRADASPSPESSLPPETQYRPAGPDEDSLEFPALAILAEDKKKRMYLVEWGDLNPKTNYDFRPNWEPKDHCTDALIQEWKEKIAEGTVKPGRQLGENLLRQWDKKMKRAMAQRKADKQKRKLEKGRKKGKVSVARKRSPRARSGSVDVAAVVQDMDQSLTQPETEGEEEQEDENGDEEDDPMETMSDEEDKAREKRKRDKARAIAEASQMTTGSEWLPPGTGGGKRKRSSVAPTEPASKKTKGRTSRRDTSAEASPAPVSTKRTTKALPGQPPKGTPPVSSRVRSRSASTASTTTAAVLAGPSKPSADKAKTRAKPKSKARNSRSGGGFGSHLPSTQKSTRFASDDEDDDVEGEEDEFEIVERRPPAGPGPEPDEDEGQFDDHNDDHGNDFFQNDDNEPYRSPSPPPTAKTAAVANDRLVERIQQIIADTANDADADVAVAATIPLPTSPTLPDNDAALTSIPRESASPDIDHTLLAQADLDMQGSQANTILDPASAPIVKAGTSKSTSRQTDAAGPSKPRNLGTVPQISTQVFRVAALQHQATTDKEAGTQSTGTQESIHQFSSPLGPTVKDKGKGKRRARIEEEMEVDEAVSPVKANEQQAEPLFLNTSSDEDEAEGVLRTGPRQVGPEPTAEEDEESIPPGMERRVVDGVAMLRAIPTSQDDYPQTQFTQTQAPRPVMVDRGTTAEPEVQEEPPTPSQFSTGEPSANANDNDNATAPSPIAPIALIAPAAPIAPVAPAAPVTPIVVIPDSELLRLNSDLTAQLAAVQAELAEVRSKKTALEKDHRFIRTQYDMASSSAVREVELNRELSAKLKIKEAQLSNGLKQKDMHHAAIAARNGQVVAELRAQNKILLDQARLTDDALRTKAAAHPRLKKENENLLEENAVLTRRVDNLTKRNETLVSQVRDLRARRMGVVQGEEEDTESGSEYSDESGSDSGSEGHEDGAGQDMRGMGYSTRAVDRTSSGEFIESTSRSGRGVQEGDEFTGTTTTLGRGAGMQEGEVDGSFVSTFESGQWTQEGERDLVIKQEDVEVGEETDGPGSAYECQVRSLEGDTKCGQLIETRDVLQEHWMSIHRPQFQPMSQ